VSRAGAEPKIRTALPRIIAEHKIAGAEFGTRRADDAWIENLARVLFAGSASEGAGAVAEAIAAGFHQDDVGEALSLASTRLILHDPGRSRDEGGKRKGTVHGASVGVHASDAAHAWRCIARVVDKENAIASLVAAGWHTAGQAGRMTPEPAQAASRDAAAKVEGTAILGALDESVRAGDQGLATALVERLGDSGADPDAVIARLLPHYLAADGALHHEKYFATQVDVVRWSRPAFRFGHLVALARVAASGAGVPAPGLAEARSLLGV
jgi:hypothetical protein